jgi:hypothetical protein
MKRLLPFLFVSFFSSMIFAQGDLSQAMSLIQDGRCADAIGPLVKVYKSSFRNSNGEKAAVMLTECYRSNTSATRPTRSPAASSNTT